MHLKLNISAHCASPSDVRSCQARPGRVAPALAAACKRDPAFPLLQVRSVTIQAAPSHYIGTTTCSSKFSSSTSFTSASFRSPSPTSLPLLSAFRASSAVRAFPAKPRADSRAVPAEVQTEFHFDIEDYLFGLANLSPELVRLFCPIYSLSRVCTQSRWAVNCVIHGDFQRPFVISAFLAELLSSFQQLNLKNDALRRKYDGIKYDVKKVEEVVYDIRVRNLGAPQ